MIFRRRDRTAATGEGSPPEAEAESDADAGATETGATEATDADTVIDLRDDRPLVHAAAGEDGGSVGGGPSQERDAPHATGARRGAPDVGLTTTLDRGPDLLIETFAEDLAGTPSGIEFIYRCLDRIASRTHADDAVLVIDNDDLGRQAFRVGGSPIESTWGRDVVRTAPLGLHLLGSSVDDGVSASVTNLSSLALRLDVATHDSLHDALTGLLNRRSFDDQLETASSQSERYGWRFALVLIDLDNFKSVNDRLGHQAGDKILRAVGAELRSGLRAGDAAARVGGDEFALILPNADESLLPSLLERLRVAVLDALPASRVGLSAGIALAPEDGCDTGSLFRMADQRLYEAKAR